MTRQHVSSLVVATLLAGCPLAGSTPPPQAAPAVQKEGEETGVKKISSDLRDFTRALGAKQFDAASKALRSAEKGVSTASTLTRSHPDFEDIEERVVAARPRYEGAVEQDRIERRNLAIDDLIRKGEQLLDRGRIILTELTTRIPEEDDITNIIELVEAETALEREGSGYLGEKRYYDHAQLRDQQTRDLAARKTQAVWQRQTSQAVTDITNLAGEAMAQAKASTGGAELAPMRGALGALEKCVSQLSDAESQPGFGADLMVSSRFGTLSAEDTKKRCLETASKLRTQVDKLSWQEAFRRSAAQVGQAISAYRGAKTNNDILVAGEVALAALEECDTQLRALQTSRAYDSAFTLDTTFGRLTLTKLSAACKTEKARIAKAQPRVRWRERANASMPIVNVAKETFDAAMNTANAAPEVWSAAIAKIEACETELSKLRADKDADRDIPLVSTLGEADIDALLAQCKTMHAQANEKLHPKPAKPAKAKR